uniref:YqaA family protein n=1 Tax=Alistipes sp. TaxID=1872444 RepID=UPI0040572A66
MEAWFEALNQLLAGWGYYGLFIAALLAGSIIPLGSEVLFVLLLKAGLNPVGCIIAATLGNTLGGMTCYWIGRLGKQEWIQRYMGISEAKLMRASRFLQGRGAWFGFFAFLPYLGEAIAITLGIMRSRQSTTALSMMIGKGLRYLLIFLLF